MINPTLKLTDWLTKKWVRTLAPTPSPTPPQKKHHFLNSKTKSEASVFCFEHVLVFPWDNKELLLFLKLPTVWWGTLFITIKSYLLELYIRF